MIEFLAKLSLEVGLPIVVVLLWKLRTGAAWTYILYALIAYLTTFLVRRPPNELATLIIRSLYDIPFLSGYHWTSLIRITVSYVVSREGVKWLMFRYAPASPRSWHEGVLFGISFSAIATIHGWTDGLLFILETYSFPLAMDLSQNSLSDILSALNDDIHYNWIRGLVRHLDFQCRKPGFPHGHDPDRSLQRPATRCVAALGFNRDLLSGSPSSRTACDGNYAPRGLQLDLCGVHVPLLRAGNTFSSGLALPLPDLIPAKSTRIHPTPCSVILAQEGHATPYIAAGTSCRLPVQSQGKRAKPTFFVRLTVELCI